MILRPSIAVATLIVWAMGFLGARAQPISGPAIGNVLQKVPLLTNLLNMRPVSAQQFVLTLGETNLWDGGGAYYRADPTNLLTPNGSTILQSSGTSTGRWLRVATIPAGSDTPAWINVRDYGAVGDGVTDDSAAINAAAAVARDNSTTLYIPPATYFITNTVNFQSGVWAEKAVFLVTNPNFDVIGAGHLDAGSTILRDVQMVLPSVTIAPATRNHSVSGTA
jgi:hypothetical protein